MENLANNPEEVKLTIPKEPPVVLKMFTSLRRGRQEYRLRIVKYKTSARLFDIREFISTASESQYTKKGVSLGYDQALTLYKLLPEILDFLNPKVNTNT